MSEGAAIREKNLHFLKRKKKKCWAWLHHQWAVSICNVRRCKQLAGRGGPTSGRGGPATGGGHPDPASQPAPCQLPFLMSPSSFLLLLPLPSFSSPACITRKRKSTRLGRC